MERYISQLLADIAAASRSENNATPVAQEETFESYIAEVERYLSGEGAKPLRRILGLEEIQFPPIERLTDQQMLHVISAFKNCLDSWNVSLEMPEKLPISLKYTLYISTLASTINIVNSGTIHLEACTYCSDNCLLGEYCECKEFEDDHSDDINVNFPNDGGLPF
jgi:hypothetical protein